MPVEHNSVVPAIREYLYALWSRHIRPQDLNEMVIFASNVWDIGTAVEAATRQAVDE